MGYIWVFDNHIVVDEWRCARGFSRPMYWKFLTNLHWYIISSHTQSINHTHINHSPIHRILHVFNFLTCIVEGAAGVGHFYRIQNRLFVFLHNVLFHLFYNQLYLFCSPRFVCICASWPWIVLFLSCK